MTGRLRIIQVVNVRWFNATAWYGLYLSKLLQDAGHEVVVLGLPGTASYERAVEWGLDARPFSNSSSPAALARLWKDCSTLVKNFRPHVVNCHRGENYLLWCLLRRTVGGFALVRTRGDQRPPAANWINRLLHRDMTDAVIATNSRMARLVEKNFSLPPAKVHTILGGVDREVFRPDPAGRAALRAALGFSDTDLVFGLLGRFDPVKGHKELIRAAALAVASGQERKEAWAENFRLLFVGRPANFSASTLKKELVDHGVRGMVIEPGEHSTLEGGPFGIPAYISAMDMGVVNSQGSEAIARAALEIMSCGVPLIGTDVGVMPDLLSASAMVSTGSVPDLALLLEKTARDAAFRQGLQREQEQRLGGLSGRDFLEKTLQAYKQAARP